MDDSHVQTFFLQKFCNLSLSSEDFDLPTVNISRNPVVQHTLISQSFRSNIWWKAYLGDIRVEPMLIRGEQC